MIKAIMFDLDGTLVQSEKLKAPTAEAEGSGASTGAGIWWRSS